MTIDLSTVRPLLLWGGLGAEAAVGFGIILESWRPNSVKEWLGFVMIVGGVFISAVCTILLFHTDEDISKAQLSKIISLESHLEAMATQLAPRTFDLSVLAKELDGVKKEPVQILFDRDDPDSMFVSDTLWQGLQKAGWTAPTPAPIPPPSEDEKNIFLEYCGDLGGIVVYGDMRALGEFKGSSSDLFKSLHKRPQIPFLGLFDSINSAARGGAVGRIGFANCPNVPPGTLQIVVLPRMQGTAAFDTSAWEDIK